MAEKSVHCEPAKRCGGCTYMGMPYEQQLMKKQQKIESLLGKFGKIEPIIGMKDPLFYRNKVHHVMTKTRDNRICSGFYEAKTHRVVPVKECLLEDRISQDIIHTVEELCRSFKIKIYDEDARTGLLRHVLIRRGFTSGEIMVVLILASPIFPSKNNFVKALREKHPKITSVVLNVNEDRTSMVLGKRNISLYGADFIKDSLCGLTFRISPDSFYQVNPVQTEVLYRTAVDFAGLTGKETVIDAYCGIGTIGLTAARSAGAVIGVELNKNAIRDAIQNARENGIRNARFYAGDAGEFLTAMAEEGKTAEVLFMDPPRTGSTKQFMDAVVKMSPRTVVYVSCGPDTLKRDLDYLTKKHYRVRKIQPVDMFPWTEHVESVVLLSKITK